MVLTGRGVVWGGGEVVEPELEDVVGGSSGGYVRADVRVGRSVAGGNPVGGPRTVEGPKGLKPVEKMEAGVKLASPACRPWTALGTGGAGSARAHVTGQYVYRYSMYAAARGFRRGGVARVWA